MMPLQYILSLGDLQDLAEGIGFKIDNEDYGKAKQKVRHVKDSLQRALQYAQQCLKLIVVLRAAQVRSADVTAIMVGSAVPGEVCGTEGDQTQPAFLKTLASSVTVDVINIDPSLGYLSFVEDTIKHDGRRPGRLFQICKERAWIPSFPQLYYAGHEGSLQALVDKHIKQVSDVFAELLSVTIAAGRRIIVCDCRGADAPIEPYFLQPLLEHQKAIGSQIAYLQAYFSNNGVLVHSAATIKDFDRHVRDSTYSVTTATMAGVQHACDGANSEAAQQAVMARIENGGLKLPFGATPAQLVLKFRLLTWERVFPQAAPLAVKQRSKAKVEADMDELLAARGCVKLMRDRTDAARDQRKRVEREHDMKRMCGYSDDDLDGEGASLGAGVAPAGAPSPDSAAPAGAPSPDSAAPAAAPSSGSAAAAEISATSQGGGAAAAVEDGLYTALIDDLLARWSGMAVIEYMQQFARNPVSLDRHKGFMGRSLNISKQRHHKILAIFQVIVRLAVQRSPDVHGSEFADSLKADLIPSDQSSVSYADDLWKGLIHGQPEDLTTLAEQGLSDVHRGSLKDGELGKLIASRYGELPGPLQAELGFIQSHLTGGHGG